MNHMNEHANSSAKRQLDKRCCFVLRGEDFHVDSDYEIYIYAKYVNI